jgi:hypothetical protein
MDLVILIAWGILGALVPITLGRYRPKLLHSVRFLAVYLSLYLGVASVILGVSTKNIVIFLVCFISSLWGGLQMLLLPRISPQIAKRFNLKW